MASSSGPVFQPPCFIVEPHYAPPCPSTASALFDAALTLQNDGAFEAAVNAVMEAQSAWEKSLLEEHYPDIEDKVAASILLRLRQEDDRQAAKAAEERRKAREAEQAARTASGSGVAVDGNADLSVLSSEPSLAAQGAPAAGEEESAAAVLQRERREKAQAKEEQRRREEEREQKEAFDREREEKRQEKIQALHHVYQLLPTAGKIFIQLRLSSIYQSAGDDERALAAAIYAMRFVETMPVYTDNSYAATVYTALGVIYAHIGAYPYASDYLFRALEIREESHGPLHVDTATSMHNVGCVLHCLQKSNDALVCYYRALKGFAEHLPPSHPRIDTCNANIRRAKETAMDGLTVPPIPFTPNAIFYPESPGSKKAKAFYAPKPKKSADPKKDGKKR